MTTNTATENSPAVSANVLTNDDIGADHGVVGTDGRLTNIASVNLPANTNAIAAGGSASIAGAFGSLSIDADGDYTYTPNISVPNGSVDTFTYTLTDGDGDTTDATLTITCPATTSRRSMLTGRPTARPVIDEGPGRNARWRARRPAMAPTTVTSRKPSAARSPTSRVTPRRRSPSSARTATKWSSSVRDHHRRRRRHPGHRRGRRRLHRLHLHADRQHQRRPTTDDFKLTIKDNDGDDLHRHPGHQDDDDEPVAKKRHRDSVGDLAVHRAATRSPVPTRPPARPVRT